MQLYSIASGSSGNCIYLGEEDGGILIDAGISRKRIVTGLERKGLSLDDIKAIFITHEHSDHISGLGPVLRKNPIPVYATADTVSAIWEKTNMNNISPGTVPQYPAGRGDRSRRNVSTSFFYFPRCSGSGVLYSGETGKKSGGGY